ncbi:MAG: hypothetical protein NC313_17675 [Butyrivibrio sp.]|nr:hypothetical protein [Butyrivibrio sp.]
MMKKSSGVKIIIIGVIIAAIVVGYFYYLANKTKETKEEDVESTLVQTTLLRDLDKNYPPSPKEVVRYFNELARCLYNEKYTEDEFDALALKAMGIYDEELNANKPVDQYLEDLKSDIEGFKALDQSISTYQLPASTEVEFYEENESSCARLYCNYNIRKGTKKFSSDVVFILRQDENKRWKILGWAESK